MELELYYDNNLYKFDQDTYQIFVNLSKLYTQKPLIKTEVGEIQLTNYGISGICTMQLSNYAVLALNQNKNVFVKI